MRKLIISSTAIMALAVACQAFALDDPEHGHKVYLESCAVCHSTKEGKNKIGPSMFGVVGRRAGSAPDYAYSEAMHSNAGIWTAAAIASYLRNPQQQVPGTKMPFKLAQASDQDIADLVAYLATLH